MSEIWSSQWAFNLSSWKSNLKKIQAWMGFEPMTLRYRCNALSTELPSHMDRWSIVSSWYTRWQWNIWIWIYENHICELRMKHEWNLILAVGFQLKQLKKQPEKNSGLNDTGAMLYPLSYQATWIDGQLWVRGIPDDSEIYEYEYMKIIYVNCGWNMSEIWSSQWAFNLSSWKSNLKKIQAWTGFEPMTLRYRCNALSTELPSHMDRWVKGVSF